jgi:D-alanine-D-alanine ligase
VGSHAADTLWLVEEYVPGRELTVAVLGGRPLAVTELRPHSGFYDYENKYTGGRTDHLIPAPIPQAIYDACLNMAKRAHEALGCTGLSRTDIRYDDTKPGQEGLYVLELNTQPGMTDLSLSPEQAAYAGIDFPTLVDMLVAQASLGH